MASDKLMGRAGPGWARTHEHARGGSPGGRPCSSKQVNTAPPALPGAHSSPGCTGRLCLGCDHARQPPRPHMSCVHTACVAGSLVTRGPRCWDPISVLLKQASSAGHSCRCGPHLPHHRVTGATGRSRHHRDARHLPWGLSGRACLGHRHCQHDPGTEGADSADTQGHRQKGPHPSKFRKLLQPSPSCSQKL